MPDLKIVVWPYYTRQDIRDHREQLFVFGDNEARIGYGGQARAARNEPNAVGIPTLHCPHRPWTDETFAKNCAVLARGFLEVIEKSNGMSAIAIPKDGIGTGRARMHSTAPQTFKMLQLMWRFMFDQELEQ